jgi:8-oxo-dGTP diphosphatase
MKREHYSLGFIFSGDKVLLQKAKAPWMEHRWNGIGGHIEEDETPMQAMARETGEEIGIGKYCNWKHSITMLCPGGTVFIFSTYIASYSVINFAKKREQEIRAFDIIDLPNYRMSNIDWMIGLCLEKPTHPPVIETGNLGA